MRLNTIRMLAAAMVLSGGSVEAQEAPAASRGPDLRGQLGASINNAGLQNTLELVWVRERISFGVAHALTPAQTRLGAWIQLSPFPVLDIKAGADPTAYFGTFNSLQGFESYDDAFDKTARELRAGAKAGAAMRVYIAPTLKAKAGPVVAAVTAEMEWWRSNAGAEYFYEPARDTLLRSSGDRLLATTAVVMHRRESARGSMSIGAIHTLTRVAAAPRNDIQKIGAIAVREFTATHFRLPHPKITLVVARYLNDRSKDGQWTAAAAVGFRTR